METHFAARARHKSRKPRPYGPGSLNASPVSDQKCTEPAARPVRLAGFLSPAPLSLPLSLSLPSLALSSFSSAAACGCSIAAFLTSGDEASSPGFGNTALGG